MFLGLAALSTPLAAQSALAFGMNWTLGSGWQVEGGELGLVRSVGGGPIRRVSAALRLGSFIDEGAIIGGAKGVAAAAVFGVHTAPLAIAEMGDETNPAAIGADLTFEAAGWLGANSPLPQGSPWASVAVLPGLRFGHAGGVQYSVAAGPTWFFGRSTDVHGFLAIRIEAPLARRAPHP